MADNLTVFGTDFTNVTGIKAIGTGNGTLTYIRPQGTKTITANGTAIDVAQYATADVSIPLVMGAVRPDAELVKTISYDKWMIEDEVLESLPAYTTTAQTIVASADAGTYTVDMDNYVYYYCIRMLAIPKYSTTSKAKGRVEWWASASCYEMADIPASSLHTYDGSKVYSSFKRAHSSAQTCYNLLYWSSGTAIALYSSGLYGVYMTVAAPSRSDNVVTLKSPAFNMRGSTTYYTSTFMNATTDIRYQYVIEMYRSQKETMNINGWGMTSQWARLVDCMDSSDWKLT